MLVVLWAKDGEGGEWLDESKGGGEMVGTEAEAA